MMIVWSVGRPQMLRLMLFVGACCAQPVLLCLTVRYIGELSAWLQIDS